MKELQFQAHWEWDFLEEGVYLERFLQPWQGDGRIVWRTGRRTDGLLSCIMPMQAQIEPQSWNIDIREHICINQLE